MCAQELHHISSRAFQNLWLRKTRVNIDNFIYLVYKAIKEFGEHVFINPFHQNGPEVLCNRNLLCPGLSLDLLCQILQIHQHNRLLISRFIQLFG